MPVLLRHTELHRNHGVSLAPVNVALYFQGRFDWQGATTGRLGASRSGLPRTTDDTTAGRVPENELRSGPGGPFADEVAEFLGVVDVFHLLALDEGGALD